MTALEDNGSWRGETHIQKSGVAYSRLWNYPLIEELKEIKSHWI